MIHRSPWIWKVKKMTVDSKMKPKEVVADYQWQQMYSLLTVKDCHRWVASNRWTQTQTNLTATDKTLKRLTVVLQRALETWIPIDQKKIGICQMSIPFPQRKRPACRMLFKYHHLSHQRLWRMNKLVALRDHNKWSSISFKVKILKPCPLLAKRKQNLEI